jgi:hypothetical protein
MAQTYVEDPNIVAYYEKEGWRAYYNHKWLRAFWLLVKLNREGFRMSRFNAYSAALNTVRASIAFAPLEGNDVPKAQKYMARFYEKARNALDIPTDAQRLAELEIDYWVVHRELAIRRKNKREDEDIEPMVNSLNALHAALFDSSLEAMRPSAEWRALAAKTVDRITGNYSDDIDEDWRRVEDYLQKAYRAVKKELL